MRHVAKCGLSTPTREHILSSVKLYEEYLVGALLGAKTILEQKSELAGQYAAKLETIAKDASTYVPKGPRSLSDWLSCKPGCAQFRLPVQRLRTVPRGGRKGACKDCGQGPGLCPPFPSQAQTTRSIFRPTSILPVSFGDRKVLFGILAP